MFSWSSISSLESFSLTRSSLVRIFTKNWLNKPNQKNPSNNQKCKSLYPEMLYVNTNTFTFSKSCLSYRQAERTCTSFSCELLLTNTLGGASKTLKATMLRLSCMCQCFFKENRVWFCLSHEWCKRSCGIVKSIWPSPTWRKALLLLPGWSARVLWVVEICDQCQGLKRSFIAHHMRRSILSISSQLVHIYRGLLSLITKSGRQTRQLASRQSKIPLPKIIEDTRLGRVGERWRSEMLPEETRSCVIRELLVSICTFFVFLDHNWS